jgi:hypothetical protein
LVAVFEDEDGGLNGLGLGDWSWIVVVSRGYVLDWRNVGAFTGATAVEHRGTSLMINFIVGVGIILRRAFGSALDGVGNWNRVIERSIQGIVVVAVAVMLTCAVLMS